MSATNALPETTVGGAEPAPGRILMTLLCVGILGLFALYATTFGWNEIPVIGDIVPLLGNLGDSGIWFYLIGLVVGIGAIVATLIAEVLAE